MENIQERVYKIVSQIMEIGIESINRDSSADNLEGWDSLKHMNLVFALEQEFNIRFTDEQIVEMLSVEHIINNIKMLL